MSYSKIEILGLRGFCDKQTLNLGIPNDKKGSGLTTIVGPNSSGKSTIYEAFRAISQNDAPSFTEGRRNKFAGDIVEIKITKTDGNSLELKTVTNKGSETTFQSNGLDNSHVKILTLPSRRTFAPFFGKSAWNRQQYVDNLQLPSIRGSQLDNFYLRLFTIQSNPTTFKTFNEVLSKIIGTVPSWHIEQADSGQYYLKFNYNESFHNSDGTGEGLLSIFTIVDALYDSNDGDVIFIDEPELSLYPSLQKKLLTLILEYSATRQIIISTHSPYFISWVSLENEGRIARTVKEKTGTKIFELQSTTIEDILKFLNDLNNPHTLGLDAREVFFLEDKVVLVEGQEDVILFGKILELKNRKINGEFYGWGVGGADKMVKIVQMLKDFGFKKVVAIFDKKESRLIPDLKTKFPDYFFTNIPTDDIRHKYDNGKEIEGLINRAGTEINEKYTSQIDVVIDDINKLLSS